jgi:MFS family permease
MQRPELVDFRQERIRVLHYTWIAFFISFYIWFNMAPLATTMLRDVGWLTEEHIKVLAIVNVAVTIPARILVGALIDKYGPRVVFSGLLITMAFPTFFFAFGNSLTQLLVSRLVLSTVGASFVIGIRMVAQWFPPKMIGRAEGFYAGWGNFGSAWAAITLPWIAITLFEDWWGIEDGWRWALFVNGLVALVYGVMYYFLVRDTPEGMPFVGVKKTSAPSDCWRGGSAASRSTVPPSSPEGRCGACTGCWPSSIWPMWRSPCRSTCRTCEPASLSPSATPSPASPPSTPPTSRTSGRSWRWSRCCRPSSSRRSRSGPRQPA